MFPLVDRNEHLHQLVASPWPEAPSAEETAMDCSLARHLDSTPVTGIADSVDIFGALPVTPRVTPTSCFWPTVLVIARTCSLSPPLKLQLRVTSLSTGAFPFGGACVVSSRTTASSLLQAFVRRLGASWCLKNRHQLLQPER